MWIYLQQLIQGNHNFKITLFNSLLISLHYVMNYSHIYDKQTDVSDDNICM